MACSPPDGFAPFNASPASPNAAAGSGCDCPPPFEKVRNLVSLQSTGVEMVVATTTKGYCAADVYFDPRGVAQWSGATFRLYAVADEVRALAASFVVGAVNLPLRPIHVTGQGVQRWELTVQLTAAPAGRFPVILITYGESPSTAVAASITLAGDVSGPSGSNIVQSISSSGGVLLVNASEFQWQGPGAGSIDFAANGSGGLSASFTLKAQSSAVAGSTGGALVLSSGAGIVANGQLNLQVGGVTKASLNSAGIFCLGETTSATGLMGFKGGVTTQITLRNNADSADLAFLASSAVDGWIIANTTITSLALVSGGALNLRGTQTQILNAAASVVYATFTSTKVTLTGTMPILGAGAAADAFSVHGSFPVAMADANQAVSAANSANTWFTATGADTAARNLTLGCNPAAGCVKAFVNNTTGGFAINVGFVSGTLVAIPAGKGGFVTGDGTNAVLLSTFTQ